MSTLTKEWLQLRIAELEEERDATPGAVNEDAAMSLAAMKIALASLEAEPVISHVGSKNALDAIVAFIKSNRNPTLKVYNEVSERLFQDNCHGLSNHVIEYIKQIGEELEELRSTQGTAPPAPVSVPDEVSWEDVPEEITEDDMALASAWAHGFNQCRAAMLQGAEPVTTKDDGGRYEQDDSPECGWVVTHSGKDYFYREQKDAVMHMNSAVESGLGVSLRSFIPEPVSEHHKLNDLVIPDAYDIEAFGIFSATEGESGLLLQIEQFWFGTENCPQVGKENMVPKFALQAIINRLQAHCNSMGEDTLIDIFASSAAPQQEVKP